MVEIVSRSAWGAMPPKVPYTTLAGSEGILAHHLGDGVTRNLAQVDYAALMRQTQAFHMGPSRNWNDFAYGFGVGGGKAYMGRGWGVIDGADTGIGRVMHSVLWLGDSYKNEIPNADMAVIWALFDEHNRRYGRKVEGGHRDINATGCPGDNIYAKLQAGRPAFVPPIPVPPVSEDKMFFSVYNAVQTKVTFRVVNNRLLHNWRVKNQPRSTTWPEVIEGLVVEDISTPLVNGTSIWIPVIADSAFGKLHLTLIQDGVGNAFTAHGTDQLDDFFANL